MPASNDFPVPGRACDFQSDEAIVVGARGKDDGTKSRRDINIFAINVGGGGTIEERDVRAARRLRHSMA